MFKSYSSIPRFLVYIKSINTKHNRFFNSSYLNTIRNFPPIVCSQLPNGLKIATQDRGSYNTCFGLYVNAGSRYETKEENGLTHFFEHLAFKATKSRNKKVLEGVLLATGAKFQCFTTREMAVYCVECLSSDFSSIFSVFMDCIFNNALTYNDVEEQKEIVLLELMEEDTNHSKVVLDYLHSSAFQNTPLEQPVMGRSFNVQHFNAKLLCSLLYKRFTPENMILTAIGNVNHDKFLVMANDYLKCLKNSESHYTGEHRFTGSDMRYRDDSMPMAHVAIAFEAPSFCHDDYNIMKLAQMVIGGWDKSQLGGLSHGTPVAKGASFENLCDSYRAFYIPYRDTALWGAHFVASKLTLGDMTFVLQDEWLKLCTIVTDEQLEAAKNQLIMKFLLVSESAKKTSHRVGRSLLYRGCYSPLLETILAIERMNANDIKTVTYKYLYDKCPVVAAIGPTENLSDYSRIRSNTYWLRL